MWRIGPSSLRSRLIILVLSALLPALGLMLYFTSAHRQIERAEVGREAQMLARMAEANHLGLVEGARQLLVTLAHLPEVSRLDGEACSRLFARLLEHSPAYLDIGATDARGLAFASAVPRPRQRDLSERPYFKRALAERDFVVGQYIVSRALGKPVVDFAYPVLDEAGEVRAVLVAAVDLSWLGQFLARIPKPKDATALLIDRQGAILARHPDPEKWIGRAFPQGALVKAMLAQGESVKEMPGPDGVRRLYAFAPLNVGANDEPDVFLGFGLSLEAAFARSERNFRISLIALALVGGLILLGAWFMGRALIARPIASLLGVTGRIAGGEMSARTGPDYEPGELGQLAAAFDSMAESLQLRHEALETASEKLRRNNRALRTLSAVNHALVRATDESKLINQICRIAVETAGYKMAWVGLAESDENKTVRLAGSSGFEGDYLEDWSVTWSEEEKGRGPTGTTIRTGKAHIIHDIAADQNYKPWRDRALARGCASALGLPLKSGDETFGALVLLASEKDAFNDHEFKILSEAALDLAFGIKAIRTQKDRDEYLNALKESEERFQSLLRSVDDVAWSANLDGSEYVYFNPALEKVYGRSIEEFKQDPGLWLETVHPEDRAKVTEGEQKLKKEGSVVQEYRIIRPDGEVRWLLDKKMIIRDERGDPVRLGGIATDITDLKKAEEALLRLNRALKTLSECNQTLVRAEDEAELLQRICDLIVEFGGYRFAWIGLPVEDEAKTVRPVAQAGYNDDYLKGVKITWSDNPTGRGPTGRAIKTGQPALARDVMTDPDFAPWREAMGQRGWRSTLGLPLMSEGRALGALTVYAAEPDAFDADEIGLFEELANDMAYGMVAIRTKAERDAGLETLRYQEFLLLEMGRIAKIGGWEFDPATGKGTWTEEVARIHDLDPDEDTDLQRGLSFYEGESRSKIERAVKEAIELGKPYDLELELVTAKDVRKWVHAIGHPRVENGKVVHVSGSFQDITESKRAEEALRESEVRFRDMAELLPTGIAELDLELRLTYANRTCLEMFGYARSEIDAGISVLERIGPADRQRVLQNIQKLVVGRDSGPQEYSLLRKDGSEIDILLNSGLVTKEGEVIGIRSTLQNITERKRAQEALKASEARYRAIFEQARDTIYFTTPEGRLVDINPAGLELFGYSKEEFRRKNVTNHFADPEDRTKINAELEEKGFIKDREVTFRRGDGSELICLDTAAVWRDQDGAILGYIGTLHDVTEIRRAEATRARLEDQLRQAQKMEAIGTLAGGIAHEFNNVLTPILGFAQIAYEDLPEGHLARGKLDHVVKAARRAQEVVRQILAFSRQDSREMQPLLLAPAIKEPLKLLKASLPSTIEIRQDIEAAQAMVMANATQIHQVVMNLCTNAAHAMHEKGGVLSVSLTEVEVGTDRAARNLDLKPGPYLQLAVGDTGVGIEPEIMKKIFDPYFTTKPPGEGTGMGLAIVHGIVTSHGGTITVYSEPGQGTVFNIYLPRIVSVDEGVSEETAEMPKGEGRVLFVDDEEQLVAYGQELLERLGYQVKAFTSSQEALAAFKADPDGFDLIITDRTMPGLTGYDLAEEMLKIRPDKPIIMCTGFSERDSEKKAKAIGIRAIAPKPIHVAKLAVTMSKLLRNKT